LDALTDIERQVYEALPGRGIRTTDEIAVASGIAPEAILGPLAMLEIAGLVERVDSRWRLARTMR
jgi:DNA processing protein